MPVRRPATALGRKMETLSESRSRRARWPFASSTGPKSWRRASRRS